MSQLGLHCRCFMNAPGRLSHPRHQAFFMHLSFAILHKTPGREGAKLFDQIFAGPRGKPKLTKVEWIPWTVIPHSTGKYFISRLPRCWVHIVSHSVVVSVATKQLKFQKSEKAIARSISLHIRTWGAVRICVSSIEFLWVPCHFARFGASLHYEWSLRDYLHKRKVWRNLTYVLFYTIGTTKLWNTDCSTSHFNLSTEFWNPMGTTTNSSLKKVESIQITSWIICMHNIPWYNYGTWPIMSFRDLPASQDSSLFRLIHQGTVLQHCRNLGRLNFRKSMARRKPED